MKNTFLSEMNSRGFLNQCTDLEGLKNILKQQTIKAYIGFDTTAPSLHVGSLMQIMILRLLQKYGHQPIVLLGGGTKCSYINCHLLFLFLINLFNSF